jgi:ATP-binding protein involved in chromosome partitioning
LGDDFFVFFVQVLVRLLILSTQSINKVYLVNSEHQFNKATNMTKHTNKTTTTECDSCPTLDNCNDEKKQQCQEQQQLKLNLSKVKHKVAVISGKGGVGKSTVTANLALTLAAEGKKVGVLDADIHGPCIPKMLGLKGQTLKGAPDGKFLPVTGKSGVKAVSMDFLLENDEVPIVWRGPLKMRAIQQFLSDVIWGELDYLLVDLPPGTGDEPLTVMQLLPDMDGVVIVTMPSEVSEAVVKKSVTFAKEIGVPVIGIVENMSGFVCPECGAKVDIFRVGGGKRIADSMAVPYLGAIPIDPRICNDADEGQCFVTKDTDSAATKAFRGIIQKIESSLN